MEKGVVFHITALHSVMQISATVRLTWMMNGTTFPENNREQRLKKKIKKNQQISFPGHRMSFFWLKSTHWNKNNLLITIGHACVLSILSGRSVIHLEMAVSHSSGWWWQIKNWPGLRPLSKLYWLSGKDIEAHRTKLSLVNRQTTHRLPFTCQINIRSDSAPGHMARNQEW